MVEAGRAWLRRRPRPGAVLSFFQWVAGGVSLLHRRRCRYAVVLLPGVVGGEEGSRLFVVGGAVFVFALYVTCRQPTSVHVMTRATGKEHHWLGWLG